MTQKERNDLVNQGTRQKKKKKKKKKEKSVQNSVPMKVVIQTIKGY